MDEAQRTIWKFLLDLTDEQCIEVPGGARLLTVQIQPLGHLRAETPVLWAIVDPDVPKVRGLIRMVGTGHPFPDADRWTYISTVQLDGGSLVLHIFVEEGVAH